MGNQNHIEETSKNVSLTNYLFMEEISNGNFENLCVYKHKNYQEYISILTKSNFKNEEHLKKIFNEISLKKENQLMFFPKILNIQQISKSEFCSSFFKLHITFEYYRNSLSREIKKRRISGKHYSEDEIWEFISKTLEFLDYFHKDENFKGNLNPSEIFITNSGEYKFLDYYFVDSYNDKYHQFLLGGADEIYFSPKLLKDLKHRSLLPIHDKSKSVIFSLGMIVLEMCSFCEIDDLLDDLEWNFSKIGDYIFNLNYSDIFRDFLEIVLEKNEENRTNCSSLFSKFGNKKISAKNKEPEKKKILMKNSRIVDLNFKYDDPYHYEYGDYKEPIQFKGFYTKENQNNDLMNKRINANDLIKEAADILEDQNRLN